VIGRRKSVYVKFIKSNMEMGLTSQQTSLDSQTLVWLRETIKKTTSVSVRHVEAPAW